MQERLIVGGGTPERTWQAWPGLHLMRHATLRELVPPSVRTVVISPHPDDEILATGGLLAMLARGMTEVCVVAVTDGGASHPGSTRWPAPMLAAHRRSESLEGLALLGLAPQIREALNVPEHDRQVASVGLSAAEDQDIELRQSVERDTAETVRLAHFLRQRSLLNTGESGAGAVQKEIASGKCGFTLVLCLGDAKFRKTNLQYFLHATIYTRRPKCDLGIGPVLLQQREHPRCMRDVANIDRLPRGAEQDPAWRSVIQAERRRKARGEGGLEQEAAIDHRGTTLFK